MHRGMQVLIATQMLSLPAFYATGTKVESLLTASQGEWGPFRPNFPVEVPLWLALALQKKKCCRIQIPAWMNVEHLEGKPCSLVHM